MTFEGLHNQKVCAGEHQSQVTWAKNRKNRKMVLNAELNLVLNSMYFIIKLEEKNILISTKVW